MDNIVQPKLSFCIPTYNRANCIKRCVNWILQYTGDDIEIIVSDNGSPDNTQEILKEIKDKRLKCFLNEKNEGVQYNIRRVLNEASGDFCFLLSDEDQVNIEAIPTIIDATHNYFDLAVLYGSIVESNGEYNLKYENRKYSKGTNAWEAFAFNHQYFSGIIINRNLYLMYVLKTREWQLKDRLFPHEYLVFSLLTFGDATSISDIIVTRHDYGNVTYTGCGVIKSAQTPEGMFATLCDRVNYIDDFICNDKIERQRLTLRNFRLLIYSASIFCYHTTRKKKVAQIHNVQCEKLNIKKIINEFNNKSMDMFLNRDIGYDDTFFNELKSIVRVLKFKCIFKNLYYTKAHFLVNRMLVRIRKILKMYY